MRKTINLGKNCIISQKLAKRSSLDENYVRILKIIWTIGEEMIFICYYDEKNCYFSTFFIFLIIFFLRVFICIVGPWSVLCYNAETPVHRSVLIYESTERTLNFSDWDATFLSDIPRNVLQNMRQYYQHLGYLHLNFNYPHFNF